MKLWRIIGRLIHFTPGLYALTLVLQVIRVSLVLVPGFIVRELFNVLTGDSRVSSPFSTGFWLLIALLVVTAIMRVVIVLTAIFVEFTTSFYSSALLRKNLFSYLINVDSDALRYAPGDQVSRLEADTRMVAEYLRALTMVIGTAMGALVAVVIMAQINVPMTLAVLVPLILVGIGVQIASANLGTLRRAKRTADSSISTFLTEMFGAVQAIKVSTAEARVIAQLRTLSASRRNAALREVMFQDLILAGFENVNAICVGVLLLLAGRAMRAGTFTVGDFALFVAYVTPISDFTMRLGENLSAYQQVKISWERLHELVPGQPRHTLVRHGPVYLTGALPPVPALSTEGTDHLITLDVQGLTYAHPTTGRGIDDISFTVAGGSFTVITGRIGAGKTTLLRVLLGLLQPTAGELRWNGQQIDNAAAFFVPPRCGYVAQVPRLFSESLRNNIVMGLPIPHATVERATQLAVLSPDLMELDTGLDTLVGPRGRTLSGGQIQRTAAARMFVRSAALLIFDDVSSALDVETEHQLWQNVGALPGVTCLAVSHRKPALRRADQIIVLNQGRVVGCGTLPELLQSCTEFQQMWQGNGDEPTESRSGAG